MLIESHSTYPTYSFKPVYTEEKWFKVVENVWGVLHASLIPVSFSRQFLSRAMLTEEYAEDYNDNNNGGHHL